MRQQHKDGRVRVTLARVVNRAPRALRVLVEARLPIRSHVHTDVPRRIFEQVAVMAAVTSHRHPLVLARSSEAHLMARHMARGVEDVERPVAEKIDTLVEWEPRRDGPLPEALVLCALQFRESRVGQHRAVKG